MLLWPSTSIVPPFKTVVFFATPPTTSFPPLSTMIPLLVWPGGTQPMTPFGISFDGTEVSQPSTFIRARSVVVNPFTTPG